MPLFHNDTSDKNIFVPLFKSSVKMNLTVDKFGMRKIYDNKESIKSIINMYLNVENFGYIGKIINNNKEEIKSIIDLNLIVEKFAMKDIVNNNENVKSNIDISLSVEVYNSEGVLVG
jgi:hypothetical protein